MLEIVRTMCKIFTSKFWCTGWPFKGTECSFLAFEANNISFKVYIYQFYTTSKQWAKVVTNQKKERAVRSLSKSFQLIAHPTMVNNDFKSLELLFLWLIFNNIFKILAWLAYQGKVYDVSGWEDHPGRFCSCPCNFQRLQYLTLYTWNKL